MTRDKPVVGFIGVGLMGQGMARNIHRGGYPLVIQGNRTPVDSLISRGATDAQTAREMAQQCDIIHLCPSNSPQVEAIVLRPGSILAGAREGLIVVETATAGPTSTVALAEEMAAAGVHMMNAPLGRTQREAEEGTLDAIIGASNAAFKRVKPVIVCIAQEPGRDIAEGFNLFAVRAVDTGTGLQFWRFFDHLISFGLNTGRLIDA